MLQNVPLNEACGSEQALWGRDAMLEALLPSCHDSCSQGHRLCSSPRHCPLNSVAAEQTITINSKNPQSGTRELRAVGFSSFSRSQKH